MADAGTAIERAIPADFDPDVVAAIDARLALIAADQDVALPLAVESGSRAWGFPSPDSDYDCRFLFVRPVRQHLTLWPRRDVIETPLDGLLDVNGWELGKALRLLVAGNAVVIEWLTSPIVYRADPAFRAMLLVLAERHAPRERVARHYLHLGERQRMRHLSDASAVSVKKLFYALRPAAALRWLRFHPNAAVAPMHFPTLIDDCDLPVALRDEIERLCEAKSHTRELGTAALSVPIAEFLDEEYAEARRVFAGRPVIAPPDAREAADALFRQIVAAAA